MRSISFRAGAFLLCLCYAGSIRAEEVQAPKYQIGMTGALAFNAFSGSQKNREVLNLSAGDAVAPVNLESTVFETGGPLFTLDNSNISFQADGEMDMATFHQWKFVMMLSGDRSTKIQYLVPQIYLGLYSLYGTLNLGNVGGVQDSMAFGGASLLGGTGGFGSSAHRAFVSMTTGCYAKVELMGDPDDATKMVILSPRLWGIQAGVSYVPDTSKVGRRNRTDIGPLADKDEYYNRHFWAFGLNFVEFLTSDLKVELSVTGVTGRPVTSQVGPNGEDIYFHPTNGVTVGGVFALDSFSIGAEYGWTDRTATLKGNYLVQPPGVPAALYEGQRAQGPRFWDVGVSIFLTDVTQLSFGYYHSERTTGFAPSDEICKAVTHIGNASMTYQVQSGVQVYLEGFYHITKNPAALYTASLPVQYMKDVDKGRCVENQRAVTALVGMKVSF